MAAAITITLLLSAIAYIVRCITQTITLLARTKISDGNSTDAESILELGPVCAQNPFSKW